MSVCCEIGTGFFNINFKDSAFKERAMAEAVGPGAHLDGRDLIPLQSVGMRIDRRNAYSTEFFKGIIRFFLPDVFQEMSHTHLHLQS